MRLLLALMLIASTAFAQDDMAVYRRGGGGGAASVSGSLDGGALVQPTVGVAQHGNVTIDGSVSAGTVVIDGNLVVAGSSSAGQYNTDHVTVSDGYVAINLGTTIDAYALHSQGGQFKLAAIPTPAAPKVLAIGTTGATSYTYFVICQDKYGNSTLPSLATTITNGNASLDPDNNYNTVTWTLPPGAYSCSVLRADVAHSIASVAAPLNGVNDTANVAGSAVAYVPRNKTADGFMDGTLTVGPILNNAAATGGVSITMSPQALVTNVSTGTDNTLSTVWAAQQFTATTTEIGGVSLYLKNGAGITTSSTITAYLYTDSAGLPGTAVADSGLTSTGQPSIVYSDGLTTAFAAVGFRLPVTTLTVGTKYWIVVQTNTSGGSFIWDSATSGTNQFATAPDSAGAPGTWTGAAKQMHFIVNGAAGDGTLVFSQNGHAIHGKSVEGFAGFFESVTGGGLKSNSVYNFGVGGFSTWGNGGRFTSVHGAALSAISTGNAGAQIQTTASGQLGAQIVATTGAAVQLVSSGLLVQGLDAANGFAQTFAVTNAGYFFSKTPFLLESIALNGLASTQTLGGDVLDAHAFTVTNVHAYTSVIASGTGNTVVRVSDGTNNCDATFSCSTDTNTTGSKSKATTGTCNFASGALLTYSVQTAGCSTTQPTLKNVSWIGNWQ